MPILVALLAAVLLLAGASPPSVEAAKKSPRCKSAKQLKSAPCKRLARSCKATKKERTKACRTLARRRAAIRRQAKRKEGRQAPAPATPVAPAAPAGPAAPTAPTAPAAPAAPVARTFTGSLGTEPLTFALRDGAIHDVSSLVYYTCADGLLYNNPVEIPGPIALGPDGSFTHEFTVTDGAKYTVSGRVDGGTAAGELAVSLVAGSYWCRGTTQWSAQG